MNCVNILCWFLNSFFFFGKRQRRRSCWSGGRRGGAGILERGKECVCELRGREGKAAKFTCIIWATVLTVVRPLRWDSIETVACLGRNPSFHIIEERVDLLSQFPKQLRLPLVRPWLEWLFELRSIRWLVSGTLSQLLTWQCSHVSPLSCGSQACTLLHQHTLHLLLPWNTNLANCGWNICTCRWSRVRRDPFVLDALYRAC